jgi:hypothetical protein
MLNLGMEVTASDLDGDGHADLIMGCPMYSETVSSGTFQRGRVFGLVSSSQYGSSVNYVDVDDATAVDLMLTGSSWYEWFGSSVAVVDSEADGPLKRFMLVGSPGYRNERGSSSGLAYVYDLSGFHAGGNTSVPPPLLCRLVGPSNLTQFGKSVSAHGPTVAIGAPGQITGNTGYSAGAVYVIEDMISAVASAGPGPRDIDIDLFHGVTGQVNGIKSYGRLGYNVGLMDVDDDGHADLIAAAPLLNANALPQSREAGAVFVWTFPLPTGSVTTATANHSIVGTHPYGRFGTAFVQGLDRRELLVGAPRATQSGEELAGVVDVCQL